MKQLRKWLVLGMTLSVPFWVVFLLFQATPAPVKSRPLPPLPTASAVGVEIKGEAARPVSSNRPVVMRSLRQPQALKAVAIVGNSGVTDTANYKTEMDAAAARLTANGVTVSKFYYGDSSFSWSDISAAAQGANFILYMGYGVYYGTMPTPTTVGGFYLDAGKIVSPGQIYNDLNGRLGSPSFAIVSHVGFAAGSAGGDLVDMGSDEAARRVKLYSDPFINMGMKAYFASNHTGDTADIIDGIFAENTMETVFKNTYYYYDMDLVDLTHPTVGYDLWLDGYDGYWHLAFVGQPSYIYTTTTQPSGTYQVYLPQVSRGSFTPCAYADPSYSQQPDMSFINANDAWYRCIQGSSSVVVAIVDSGMNMTHPDLASNITGGYDFIDNDSNPEDGNGHGSNVGGIVGAPINSVGVVGVAPKTRLLPVRVLDDEGSGPYSAIAAGVRYAADNAHILNMSLGGTSDSSVLRDAVNYAVNTRGRLVVVSAGNCGDPSSYHLNGCTYVDQPGYPASYDNVFTVAAVNNSDVQASFSNQGSYVDIAAPGVNIYNCYRYGAYLAESGTSQASPHVAGLAALILAVHPEYNAGQLRYVIENTSVDLGTAGKDIQFGSGRINVATALNIPATLRLSEAAAPTLLALPAPKDSREAEIVAGRVLIKFKPEVTAAQISRLLAGVKGLQVVGEISGLEVRILSVPAGEEWKQVDALRELPGVLYAEPDYIAHQH